MLSYWLDEFSPSKIPISAEYIKHSSGSSSQVGLTFK